MLILCEDCKVHVSYKDWFLVHLLSKGHSANVKRDKLEGWVTNEYWIKHYVLYRRLNAIVDYVEIVDMFSRYGIVSNLLVEVEEDIMIFEYEDSDAVERALKGLRDVKPEIYEVWRLRDVAIEELRLMFPTKSFIRTERMAAFTKFDFTHELSNLKFNEDED